MPELPLASNFYAASDADGKFQSGEVFHIERNDRGGSLATPIARYFVTRPEIGIEGFHPHSRIDCFVREHHLAPSEDWLGRKLADILIDHGVVGEPVWISWHRAKETGGEDRGDVFDLD